MGGLGCGCSAVAALFALIAFVPLLGWLNWITSIPVSIVAFILSVVALRRDEQRTLATLGLLVSVLTFFWAMFRLSLGGGIL